MLTLRTSQERGYADHGWLKARHHFSFARYYDPERLGHGALRVWNDDEIAAGLGIPVALVDEVTGDRHTIPLRRW